MFAVNSLLYLNQSVPPYGVSLNSQTNGTTAFPLRKHVLKTHNKCRQSGLNNVYAILYLLMFPWQAFRKK